MATGQIESWGGAMTDIGPLYPFVGTEMGLWIIGSALWIVWHVWQGRFESGTYAEGETKYKGETLAKAIRGEE